MNIRALLATPLLLASLNAAAICPASLPQQAPAVPDGAVTGEAGMLAAQTAAQAYVHAIERYLDCREPLLGTEHHDLLVGEAERAAQAYNTQLHRYLERREMLADS